MTRQPHGLARQMAETLVPKIERIARLNDRVRHGLDRSARRVITQGCVGLFCSSDMPSAIIAQAEIMREIRHHDFADDAHGERDFGAFSVRGEKLLFKIDYYDPDMEHGSEDPSDASQTTRVLTIMLAQEY